MIIYADGVSNTKTVALTATGINNLMPDPVFIARDTHADSLHIGWQKDNLNYWTLRFDGSSVTKVVKYKVNGSSQANLLAMAQSRDSTENVLVEAGNGQELSHVWMQITDIASD